MRHPGLVLLLAPFLGLAACGDAPVPTDPGRASVEALTTGAIVAATDIPSATRLVPYRAEASFGPASPALTFCTEPPGYAGPPVALGAVNVGTGTHAHLGRATSTIMIDWCALTASGVLGGGTFEHVGANGDAISGLWDALFTPPTFTFVHNGKDSPIVVTGGSGRFEGASGHVSGTGTIDPATGLGTFSVKGGISSVGSLK